MNFNVARSFVYRNARPLDIARWRYLFENGNKEEVITALLSYQNEDGGFAHALEPDCWNPNSAPIQTWVATELINEIGLEDKNHPLIRGILCYLSSQVNFDGNSWDNTISTNNYYPHADWWTYQPVQSLPYNPTASLIGFILKFAEPYESLHALSVKLAKEAYQYFKEVCPTDSVSTATCFVRLYEYLKESSIYDLIDMEEFNTLLHHQIKHLITDDTESWKTEYVCKPSQFITSKESDFYLANQEICDVECKFITDTQNEDGTWSINWVWTGYPEEWYISKNWWKSDWIIKNIRFYREMNR